MLFNSDVFAIFLLIVFTIYYLPVARKFQVVILLISSFVFYSWHNVYLLLLLVVSLLINGLTSYWVIHTDSKTKQKQLAIAGVVANLLILFSFKYSGLFARTFLHTTSSVGNFLISLPLPIGISFFTFQGISLVVDLFNGEKISRKYGSAAKNLWEHLLNTSFFIAFFPQLVAGPIVKAHEFLPQIRDKFFRDIQWVLCFKNIVTGFFLKSVIADNMKEFTYWIQFPEFTTKSTLTLLTMLYGYSIQIFADFAGYSLIAIGISRLFGYNLNDNFNFPYIARSFSDFWRRWHISLSTFLRDYLYIPLGGNRKGKFKTYFNLFITMVLGGLWHGAAWSYAVWGLFHGLVLAVERFMVNNFAILRKKSRIAVFLYTIFIFFCVTWAWLLFMLPEFSHVIEFTRSLGNNLFVLSDYNLVTAVILLSVPVMIYHFIYLSKQYSSVSYKKYIVPAEPVLFGFMLFLIFTNSGTSQEFIYFQF